jgi:hypothetical protein
VTSKRALLSVASAGRQRVLRGRDLEACSVAG